MSESNTAEEADDTEETSEVTKNEFFDRLSIEGLTIDGDFVMPHGEGRQRRYFRYDPGLVAGFDAVREDGEIVAQQVSNHDTAHTEQIEKSVAEDEILPKVRDGFGIWGLAQVESSASETTARADRGQGDDDIEPMDDEEVLETIQNNFEEHGFFAEDDDGDMQVVSLASPGARLLGYITGSHVKSLPNGLQTVGDYRQAVAQALRGIEDEEVFESAGFDMPSGGDDIPIATDEMMETFEEYGQLVAEDEDLKEKLSRDVERRWEDGEYDHLSQEE